MKKSLLFLLLIGLLGCRQPTKVKEMHFGPGPGEESVDDDMEDRCNRCATSYKIP